MELAAREWVRHALDEPFRGQDLMSSLDVPILFIIGSGDEADRIAHAGGTKILVTGSSDLHKLLLPSDPYELLHMSRNFFRQTRETRLQHYHMLVNLITEPEQNVRTLGNLRKLLRGVPGKVINPPEAVLNSTRDRVARLLTGIPGLVVPRALRLLGNKPAVAERMLKAAAISPPLILRQAGTHGGKIIGCFKTIDEMVATLEPGREHVATEFVDFVSPDGLYRKYRLLFIGRHRVLRHMLIAPDWNVHGSARYDFMASRPELVAQEQAIMESPAQFAPSVERVFDEVRRRMPLDFFGMDFAITGDGEVVLFEANATMSFFPFATDPQFDYSRRCIAPARAAFRELLGLPPMSNPRMPIQVSIQPA